MEVGGLQIPVWQGGGLAVPLGLSASYNVPFRSGVSIRRTLRIANLNR
jgi:hypothetical protein